MVELERLRLDLRHDDDRTAGSEQRALDQQLFRDALLALRLADHGNIEAPRNAPEQVGRAGDAGIEQAGLGRYARGLGRRLEIGDRGLGGLGVLLALDLDQVGRDAAEQAARDHRLIDEGDADDVRAVGLGHRDRIVGGDVAASRRRRD